MQLMGDTPQKYAAGKIKSSAALLSKTGQDYVH
jgi:hypothetical protein